MRPIILRGHERPVNRIKFNRDGDLVVSAGTDKLCSIFYTDNGERLGTFDGHTGSVNSVDINYDSTRLLTGASDSKATLWELSTGKEIHSWQHKAWSVKHVEFSYGDKLCIQVTDPAQENPSTIKIYDIANEFSDTPKFEIPMNNKNVKFTQASWGFLNQTIIAVDETGNISKFDSETGKLIQKVEAHSKRINSFSFDQYKMTMITASDDYSAKLFDTNTMTQRRVYQTHVPIRSATISPIMDQVAIAGGQAAKDVTTTRVDVSQFSIRIYHQVYGDEIGKIRGHFGPIHGLSYAPDGRSIVSCSEDAFIRINKFDEDYFKNFSIEKDIDDLRLPETNQN
eukprot:TRINITY_DN5771_c0_g1_i1.p1 TRINITY_DN5771_c0_g1~~TRINITY_DN5771_c0_g1_i1.p1  ORF type:complete len:340 (-),score=83.52 TRINITY_DN5771_c0_g1_i1:24-1043(-)